MKKIIIIITLLPTLLSAQNSWDINQRKGKLFFSVGAEYRITPLKYGERNFSLNSIAISEDVQNSGAAFLYSFDFFATKNLSLGFSHNFRYDLVSNSGSINKVDNFAFDKANYGLINGYHFYIDNHFKVFKEGELFLRLGKSMLNRGTGVSYRKSLFDGNGNIIGDAYSTENFAFKPWNFAIGYKKNKTSLIVGLYTSSNTNYYDSDLSFLVPYFTFKYNLGKL
jgi:hypothetical protein